jgi:hypothetical protein
MAAMDAQLLGPGYGRGEGLLSLEFNQAGRAFGRADTVPLAFFGVHGKQGHGVSFFKHSRVLKGFPNSLPDW